MYYYYYFWGIGFQKDGIKFMIGFVFTREMRCSLLREEHSLMNWVNMEEDPLKSVFIAREYQKFPVCRSRSSSETLKKLEGDNNFIFYLN